jgi:soluble lytic murein transglycosylase-like protein
MDRMIMRDYLSYKAVEAANHSIEIPCGPSDSEIESLSFIDLYHIDMKLVKRKLELGGKPLIVQLDETINILSKEHGVDPRLVKAVIRVESFYDPYAKSSAGACGLMQLMPKTAKQMGVKDIFNPLDNIIGGIKYLKYLKTTHKIRSEKLLLAAYNAGPANVKRHRGVPPFPETIDYIKKVRSFKKEMDV